MDSSLLNPALRLGASLTASLALAWALARGLGAWLRSARGRRYATRGQRGEVEARRLLSAAGYRVLSEQPRCEIRLKVDGVERLYHLSPDFLCRRWGRLYVADAKTGQGVDPLHPATRRQLLEYMCAFSAAGALVVDVPTGRVQRLDLRGLPRRTTSLPALWWLALLGSGLLAALVLHP